MAILSDQKTSMWQKIKNSTKHNSIKTDNDNEDAI